jgi:hypothetical protein
MDAITESSMDYHDFIGDCAREFGGGNYSNARTIIMNRDFCRI